MSPLANDSKMGNQRWGEWFLCGPFRKRGSGEPAHAHATQGIPRAIGRPANTKWLSRFMTREQSNHGSCLLGEARQIKIHLEPLNKLAFKTVLVYRIA